MGNYFHGRKENIFLRELISWIIIIINLFDAGNKNMQIMYIIKNSYF